MGPRETAHDEAFGSFYAVEFDNVFRVSLLFCGDRDRAADATQEAFVRAYARWSRLGKETWAAGWVVTTALNLTRRQFRRDRRLQSALSKPGAGPHAEEPPSADRMAVSEALQELGPRQRMAVVLYYLVDLPIPAVAHLMGCSEGTVKAHLAQSRERLRSLMEVPSG